MVVFVMTSVEVDFLAIYLVLFDVSVVVLARFVQDLVAVFFTFILFNSIKYLSFIRMSFIRF